MTAESSTINTPATINPQLKATCEVLINQRIEKGFHRELGMTPAEYIHSFDNAIEDIARKEAAPEGAVLGLIDERIPFARQLELLGIELDPGVLEEVVTHSEKQPYAVWLKTIGPREGPFVGSRNYQEAINNLSGQSRPATPLEGISTNVADVIAKNYVSLPGGEYRTPGVLTAGFRSDTLCLDRCFGRTRISHVPLNEIDYLVGMLVAYR